jgi:hypothetical protein
MSPLLLLPLLTDVDAAAAFSPLAHDDRRLLPSSSLVFAERDKHFLSQLRTALHRPSVTEQMPRAPAVAASDATAAADCEQLPRAPPPTATAAANGQ